MVQNVVRDLQMTVTYEHARTYRLPRPREQPPLPLLGLDLEVGASNGETYRILHGQHGASLVWREYHFEYAVRVISSWFHTHALVQSEMWVLQSRAADSLPADHIKTCTRQRQCNSSMSKPGASVPIDSTISEMQQKIRSRQPDALRCAYKSRSATVGAFEYGRAPLRSTATNCDGWIIKSGSVITLIAFNQGASEGEQHHRWFPILTRA